MLDPELDDAQMKIIFENVRRYLPHLAQTAKVYFDSLVEQGFTDGQALTLTTGYIQTLTKGN